jgi:hypothetical protein
MALWGTDNILNVTIIQLFIGAFFYHSMLNRVPFFDDQGRVTQQVRDPHDKLSSTIRIKCAPAA